MRGLKKVYYDFGCSLLDAIKEKLEQCEYAGEVNEWEYLSLMLPSGFSVRFGSWGRGTKPFYVILYSGERYLFELDLSLIVKSESGLTWYLSKPANKINQVVLNKLLSFHRSLPVWYAEAVSKNKRELQSGVNVRRSGYLACESSTWASVADTMVDVIIAVAAAHSCNVEDGRSSYGFGDKKAIEGYEFDLTVAARKRDRDIMEKRKVLDEYACQCCGYCRKVGDSYVIDCHHKDPISYGARETSLDDLISLCPNCHRVAHTRRPPIGIDELKELVGSA